MSTESAVLPYYINPTSAKFVETVTGKWIVSFCNDDTVVSKSLLVELFSACPPVDDSPVWKLDTHPYYDDVEPEFIPGFDRVLTNHCGGDAKDSHISYRYCISLKNRETGVIWGTGLPNWREHPKFIELLQRDLRAADRDGISIVFVPTGAKSRIRRDDYGIEDIEVEVDKNQIIRELRSKDAAESFLARLAIDKGIEAVEQWVEDHTISLP